VDKLAALRRDDRSSEGQHEEDAAAKRNERLHVGHQPIVAFSYMYNVGPEANS
jgi:hypothetical protein